ncbi:MAG: N-acetyltransferase [Herpetosiphonaceae bacterium]|nr:MAG: N-acetyltransferase [Herpetosiphonaceae bacterium]
MRLFGERGAYAGCWCMWWRLTGNEFSANRGAGNKQMLRQLVDSGRVPGLLAYVGDQPAGWCSVAPRREFVRFERSRYWKPVDDQPVWSIVCFYVDRRYRGRGLARALLRAAVRYAAEHGAEVVEGYPRDSGQRLDASSLYIGSVAMFREAGFEEVARRHPERPVMRLRLR